MDDLNGIFAFAIYDSIQDSYFIARDHMGIIPLYMGWDKDGTFYVASELKALEGICVKIELFPPAISSTVISRHQPDGIRETGLTLRSSKITPPVLKIYMMPYLKQFIDN